MNVYISQPMKNRSKEEILDERAKGEAAVRVYYPSAEFLNSYFDDYDTSEHTPMDYFAMTSDFLLRLIWLHFFQCILDLVDAR